MVIWKFEEVPGVVQHALKPLRHYEGTNDTPTMPWLELQNCSCNCTKWPRTDLVLVNNENEEEEKEELTESDGGHSDSEESSDDNITDADLDHHVQRSNMETVSDATDALPATESFKLKGCSFHPSMQHALRQAQRLIAANKEVLVTIFEHSANVRDDNALMAKILINNMYEPVGYIPGRKVKKVKASLDNKELTSALLKRVHRQYIPALNDFMLFGYIHITKRGPWLPDNKSYKYNS